MTTIPVSPPGAALVVLTLATSVLACGGEGGTGPPDGPALRILAGANVTDTIGATPVQGLVVQVLGSDGEPEVGVDVRFEAHRDELFRRSVYVGTVAQPGFGQVAGVTTDAEGRATVRVRLGEVAGPAIVVVSVPLHSLVDTAEYTVRPGNPTRVLLSPRDTLVSPGASFTYGGTTVDRENNPRSDPATYEVRGTAVSVDATGRVTALQPGGAVVRVSASLGDEVLTDSGMVAVAPEARIAWTTGARTVALTSLAGADTVTLVGAFALAPFWAPGGNRLVYVGTGELGIADLGGNTTSLPTPGVTNPTWPEFSADGQWIYFHGTQAGGTRIFRIRPDGADLELVGPAQGTAMMPTPSPGGGSVAWIAPGGLLVIRDLASGTERTLTSVSDALAPRWSPDGQWIAYTVGDGGALMLVRPDGSGLHRIGSRGMRAGITWSPDSRWIIGQDFRIMLADVTTNVITQLTWRGEYPAWRP